MAISGSNDISLLQMGIGLLPVGISLFLSWKYKLGLSKSLIIGVVRGTIQLVAVGSFFGLFDNQTPGCSLPLSCLWWGRLPSPL